MESSKNLSNIYTEIQIEIFSYFVPKDFIKLACCSKFFYKLFQTGEFWKAYANKLGPKAIVFPTNIQVSSDDFFTFFKTAAKNFYSKETSIGKSLTLLGIEASSTDFSQSIEKVLGDEKDSFWSSIGSDDNNSKEYLLFLFHKYVVVPFSVHVTFFTAVGFYETGTYEFPSQYIQVQFSTDGNVWEFESEIVPVNNKHKVEIKILGKVGVARYMRVIFIGKTVKQPTDDLYYVAVEKIECFGYKIDKTDQANTNLNNLLIKSWSEWKKEQFNSNSMQIEQRNIIPELLSYYENQIFSEEIYSQFLHLLKEKDYENIWNYLKENKYLRVKTNTFVDIYKEVKDFSLYYFEKITKEEKRRILNPQETLLLLCLYLNLHSSPAEFEDIVQVLNHHYNKQVFLDISYFQTSTKFLAKAKEVTGKGNLMALEYLKDAKKRKDFINLI